MGFIRLLVLIIEKMGTLTEKERQAVIEAAYSYIENIADKTPTTRQEAIDRLIKIFTAGAEFLAELRKEETPSEWVDVNVRVPESGRCVLLYSKEGRVAEGAYNNVKGVYEQWRWNAIVNPTHWMYLPIPPSEKEEATMAFDKALVSAGHTDPIFEEEAPSEYLVDRIVGKLCLESENIILNGESRRVVFEEYYTNVARIIAKLLTPDVNAELLEALTELVRLKEWKDKFGKDPYYLCTQPSVWRKANEAIQNAQPK